MESFPLFFRIRAITFAVIMLFSFLWLVMLSVEMFARWTMSDEISQSLMFLYILTNTITLILLPILILVKFRVWLDTARLILLLVLQVGSAAAGTYWSPKIQCPDQTPDDTGVCQLIGVYTLIACWIIPAILFFYSTYFAVVVYLQSRIPVVVEPKCRSSADCEMGSADSSLRDIMKGIIKTQGSGTDMIDQPRSPVLPTVVHTGPLSLPRSLALQPQLTLPNAPRHQSTMPPLPHVSQQHLLALDSVTSRHRSLPTFKHCNEPHVRPVLTLHISHPFTTNKSPSIPQTPSSFSYSTPSARSQSQSSNSGPGHTSVQSFGDNRWRSRHLSVMPLSSSPREMQSAGKSSTNYSKQARLSKPLPPHFM